MKHMIENLREAFDENNIGVTLIFGVAIISFIYLFIKNTPAGIVLITIFIGVCCYLWGYVKGIDKEKNKGK